MIKLLKYIFFPNWETIESFRGKWDITYYDENLGRDEMYNKFSVYEIQLSKIRNSFRMKLEGYKPNQHPMYEYALSQYRKLKYGELNETK